MVQIGDRYIDELSIYNTKFVICGYTAKIGNHITEINIEQLVKIYKLDDLEILKAKAILESVK